MLIFVIMMAEFSVILANAFDTVALEHGLSYKEGGAGAWGQAGAAYLSFALCALPAATLRNLQYSARHITGPVLLDCKWYDRLVELCLDGQNEISADIPAPEGGVSSRLISKPLFLEMLDFCREG